MEKYNIPKTEEELRTERAGKVSSFLDRVNGFEYAQRILIDQEGIEKPDFKEFEDFLVRLNGIARDIPIHKRRIDGDGVHLSGFIGNIEVPRDEDKEGLLRYAYEKGQLINKEDLKFLLPSVINAVHLFADGNGRTSRIIHLLLGEFSSKEEFDVELKKSLGEFGRDDSYDINPGLIGYELQQEVLKKHGWAYSEESPRGVLGLIKAGIASIEIKDLEKESLSFDVARQLLDFTSDNSRYVLTAIYMEVGDRIQNFMSEYGKTKTLRVSPKRMLEALSPEQWQRMLDNFYQLKKEQVETLVDIFTYPEKYPVSDDDQETLRDLFISKIKEHKE